MLYVIEVANPYPGLFQMVMKNDTEPMCSTDEKELAKQAWVMNDPDNKSYIGYHRVVPYVPEGHNSMAGMICEENVPVENTQIDAPDITNNQTPPQELVGQDSPDSAPEKLEPATEEQTEPPSPYTPDNGVPANEGKPGGDQDDVASIS